MVLQQARNIYIVGIKGVAMTNLAIILKKMTKTVSGSDIKEEFITEPLLKKYKINYSVGFKKDKLPKNTDLLIYSAAHGGVVNPQIIEGKKRGVKIFSQAEIIGELCQHFKNVIAVCGCHGKTTTSALLVFALKKLGRSPSYLIGAPTFNDMPGGDYDGKEYFVIEADEYGINPPYDSTPKFFFLKPTDIIATNIDFDHPDVYKNLKETKKAFLKFFYDSIRRDNFKKLFLCSDDINLMEAAKTLPKNKLLTFGYNNKSDFNINKERFFISIPGEKNRSNAGGVILCLLNFGFSLEKIKNSIKDFSGAKRRFEKVFSRNEIDVYDDYGHHPTEIKATIMAAKERFKGRRIIVLFQPHTYSRTKSLLDGFADSLSLADYSLLLPIFASAREKKADYKISSLDIERQAVKNKQRNVITFKLKKDMLGRLKKILKKGDVVFTMGAGDIYKISDHIIDIVKSKFKNPAWQSQKPKAMTGR